MRTAVRTFRLTHPVIDLLAKDAERRQVNQADIVREALAKYFEGRQLEAALLGIEQRLAQRLDMQQQTLHQGLDKILSLAVPA
jgi:hypothetical protein